MDKRLTKWRDFNSGVKHWKSSQDELIATLPTRGKKSTGVRAKRVVRRVPNTNRVVAKTKFEPIADPS